MIRISTNTIFDMGTARMGELQSSLARTTEQIATGRRLLTPSDDPVAAAQALEMSQAKELNAQFAVNRQGARQSLNTEESALKALTLLIQDVQTLTVSAGNGAMDNPQRQFMATELRGRLDDLMGIANTRDGMGNFLFAGFQTATQAFNRTQAGVVYAGDQGSRSVQAGATRHIAVNDTGDAVFQNIKTGNGLFNIDVPLANQGSGVVAMGASTTGTPLTERYEVQFVNDSEYVVVDSTGVPGPQQAFVAGQTITVGSAQFSITGSPQTNDTFVIEPVRNQGVFETLDSLVALLERPANGDAGKAALTNGLSAVGRSLSNSLDNVLSVRASVGARLNELDALDSQGTDRDVQLAQSLAELQELDYTQAISDLTKKQIILEAAQQTFVKTSGMSLFNFI